MSLGEEPGAPMVGANGRCGGDSGAAGGRGESWTEAAAAAGEGLREEVKGGA